MAQAAKEQLSLEKVLFMPTGCPPHKNIDSIADKKHRSNMVQLAIEDNEDFEFSDFELNRTGIIYTADTLKMLKNINPEDEFFFIMGADSLLNIESWKNPKEIFALCTIVVADRNEQEDNVKDKIQFLRSKYCGKIIFINAPLVNISSSYIRNCVKNHSSIKYLVHSKVERYIYENELYAINKDNT